MKGKEKKGKKSEELGKNRDGWSLMYLIIVEKSFFLGIEFLSVQAIDNRSLC